MALPHQPFQKTKYACYYSYLASSSVFCLPSMLFLTFRETYGVSYTLLGTLVFVNFCTQWVIDLVFTFFAKHFNIPRTVRLMPLLTSLGLLVYAIVPWLFPRYAYMGLLTGTVIFSAAAGLGEVLLSPVVAAIPSKTPERDMSVLHSLYAYGVVGVAVVSSLFFHWFGVHRWMFLTLFWAALPLAACVLFCVSPIPEMALSQPDAPQKRNLTKKRNLTLTLCVACIFLGSASENTMTNWISGYMENALSLSKAVCDVLGLALFAVLLGLGRTWYAKHGKNIVRVLLCGMAGAAVCYLAAGLSPVPFLSVAACVLTGLFTSMLWPGTLLLMEEKAPEVGVSAYAMMAAGGDLGGSIAPQLLGMVVDAASESDWAARLGQSWALSPEQVGMKAGMLTAALFPLLGTVLLWFMRRYFAKK